MTTQLARVVMPLGGFAKFGELGDGGDGRHGYPAFLLRDGKGGVNAKGWIENRYVASVNRMQRWSIRPGEEVRPHI